MEAQKTLALESQRIGKNKTTNYKQMKRSYIVLALVTIMAIPATAQKLNNIGFDFAAYVVRAPKHSLEGDKYNPYMENSSSAFGFFYERYLGHYPYSIKTGIYINKQYESVGSLHIPIEVNGSILGKRNQSFAYLGYTGGFSYNRIIVESSSILHFPPEGTKATYTTKRSGYIAPHAGLNAGLNLGKVCLSGTFLYHFLVPEFMDYTVTYNNNTVTEKNTNKNHGLSIRFGLSYRF